MCFDDIKLLLINAYLPFEDGNAWTDEFTGELFIIADLIGRHPDFNVILGGDFIVELSRDRLHTSLLDTFCQETDICPCFKHAHCSDDYIYQFDLSIFNVLDHFILSALMFVNSVEQMLVIHDVDNFQSTRRLDLT